MAPSDAATAPTLHGERVTLRPFEQSDVLRLVPIMQEPEVARWWGSHDAARIRRDLLDDPENVTFAVEVDRELIGVVMYSEETDDDYRHAGIDIALTTTRHGQGLGTETLRLLGRYLLEARSHHRLTIDPAAANEVAIRAYEAVGFRPVGVMRNYERGVDGTWRDGLLMDLLADELR